MTLWKSAVLMGCLFVSPFAMAQEEVVIDDQAMNELQKTANEVGGHVALVKVDDNGNPVEGEQAIFIAPEGLESESSLALEDSEKTKDSWKDLKGEMGPLVGIPNIPGIRFEVKGLKGLVGAGVDVGTAIGYSLNGSLNLTIAPLAPVGFNNLYAGYRLYGLKWFSVDGGRGSKESISAFVAGLRFKGFFAEIGKGKSRQRFNDGELRVHDEWVGSIGFVHTFFTKKSKR